MKKCYIAGKITGTNDFKERFAKAEQEVNRMGLLPINPVALPHNHDKSWASYMKECIAELMGCDCIYLLKGWDKSPGAKLEHSIANFKGMEIFFE